MAGKITARQIKQARQRLGESQSEFATRFAVNQATAHRWETDGPPENGPAMILLRQLLEQIGERV